MAIGKCNEGLEGVTVTSMWRSHLGKMTVIEKRQSLRKKSLTSLSFTKLLPENQTNHKDSRNSKEIQGFCEHLGFYLFFLNLHGVLDFW